MQETQSQGSVAGMTIKISTQNLSNCANCKHWPKHRGETLRKDRNNRKRGSNWVKCCGGRRERVHSTARAFSSTQSKTDTNQAIAPI